MTRYTQDAIESYDLLQKVYGNYNQVQARITTILSGDLNKSKKSNILEIGCGTGITTKCILKASENIKITSIDIDERMISITKNNISREAQVEFHNSDILAFFEDQTDLAYDGIVSGFTIHNFTHNDRHRLYQEVLRTLKVGGKFINVDKFASNDASTRIKSLSYRIGTYVETLAPLGKWDLLNEWVNHYFQDFQPDRIMLFGEVESSLKELGFSDVRFPFKSENEMLGVLTATKM